MSFRLRLFLSFALLTTAALWFFLQDIRDDLVPGMRQSLEEVLVDTANLLAVTVKEEVIRGQIAEGEFADRMMQLGHRRMEAVIWFLHKREPSLIVYITDAAGRVIYDSRGRDLGADYSRWNDVYLTLQGKYGARTSRENPDDPLSSVMYVAAPILSEGRIIGVLTVGKPSSTVSPFVEAVQQSLVHKALLLLAIAFLLGWLFSWGLTASIRRLTRYAEAVQRGERIPPPQLRERELALLSQAMGAMRTELEGKSYVEDYLHTLTHELKSPLAAIRGAAELLDEELPPERRARFLANIRSQSERLHQIVERLLTLAALEKRQVLDHPEAIDIGTLIGELCREKLPLLEACNLTITQQLDSAVTLAGEAFLLRQAIGNLLDNAIDFSPTGGVIALQSSVTAGNWSLEIRDQGPGIPDFALPRLFERFFSLPRPAGGAKGTGLGLPLVQEVALLHHGEIRLYNHPDGGAVARLRLPVGSIP